jgi:hypothetical protein
VGGSVVVGVGSTPTPGGKLPNLAHPTSTRQAAKPKPNSKHAFFFILPSQQIG